MEDSYDGDGARLEHADGDMGGHQHPGQKQLFNSHITHSQLLSESLQHQFTNESINFSVVDGH